MMDGKTDTQTDINKYRDNEAEIEEIGEAVDHLRSQTYKHA